MANEGAAFADALKAAQEAGFAEADPTLDITGGDAGHKLAIIAGLAFGARVLPSEIPTEGIEQVDPRDIQYARNFGYVIRPLAVAERAEAGALDLRVHPALVPQGDPLAHVDGALNAVAIQGEMVGPSFLAGLGAGAAPTATSVAGDIIDIAKNSRAGAPARTWNLPTGGDQKLQALADLSSRYYLRFSVRDESGVLAALLRKAGRLGHLNRANGPGRGLRRRGDRDDCHADAPCTRRGRSRFSACNRRHPSHDSPHAPDSHRRVRVVPPHPCPRSRRPGKVSLRRTVSRWQVRT